MTRAGATARAPGKIMLAGEYAVLEGHPALVMAVDRYAVARAGRAAQLSPFVEAARRLWSGSPAGARLLESVAIDTNSLMHESGRKLGLGSSAAATVAAVALAMGQDGRLDHAALHALAHRAHGNAQAELGARGSGADVAASVWGGVVEVRPAPSALDVPAVRVIDHGVPGSLALAGGAIAFLAVWTGTAANTRNLVAQIADWARRDPGRYTRRTEAIGQVALGLGQAIADQDPAAAVDEVARGCEALAALARDSGVPLLPEALETVQNRARAAGASVKPTGAGGGDLLLLCSRDEEELGRLGGELTELGMTVVPLCVDPRGAHLETEP